MDIESAIAAVPLLPHKAVPRQSAPSATVFSSTMNLCNTILGAGMLSIPYALHRVGFLLGVLLIGVSACAAAFGLHLLAASAELLGYGRHRLHPFGGPTPAASSSAPAEDESAEDACGVDSTVSSPFRIPSRWPHCGTEREHLLPASLPSASHSAKRAGNTGDADALGPRRSQQPTSSVETPPQTPRKKRARRASYHHLETSAYGTLTAAASPVTPASYFVVARATYPHAALFIDLAIALKCFGVSVSYLIVVGDLMPSAISTLFHIPLGSSPWVHRRLWITLFTIGLAPLTFLRKLDNLRFTSYVAMGSVAYLLFIIVYHSLIPDGPHAAPEDLEWFQSGPSLISALPIFVFAFTCHQNVSALCSLVSSRGLFNL